jgi:protein phosphatase PTC7
MLLFIIGLVHSCLPSCVALLLQLRVKFRTPQLEHEFGCPYQLGHHRYANSPADADLSTLPVVAGDIIIMGSDGLLDNMSDKEMVQQVRGDMYIIESQCQSAQQPRSMPLYL